MKEPFGCHYGRQMVKTEGQIHLNFLKPPFPSKVEPGTPGQMRVALPS